MIKKSHEIKFRFRLEAGQYENVSVKEWVSAFKPRNRFIEIEFDYNEAPTGSDVSTKAAENKGNGDEAVEKSRASQRTCLPMALLVCSSVSNRFENEADEDRDIGRLRSSMVIPRGRVARRFRVSRRYLASRRRQHERQ